jgi:hypothetical protein
MLLLQYMFLTLDYDMDVQRCCYFPTLQAKSTWVPRKIEMGVWDLKISASKLL